MDMFCIVFRLLRFDMRINGDRLYIFPQENKKHLVRETELYAYTFLSKVGRTIPLTKRYCVRSYKNISVPWAYKELWGYNEGL